MKRSVFIAILLSLFMFQSLWNVAAAFCAHENASVSNHTNQPYHFGHHLDVSLSVNQHSESKSHGVKNITGHVPAVWMDHHDHLPTCMHIVVVEIKQNAPEPSRSGYLTRSIYDWANTYKSPHLSRFNPPPVLTPL
ncbi:cation transporter [Acinetobacter sp. S40]|uniref:cation efflux protein, CzcI-like n=1 Tax=Acinetobacter sp. S40 TaxID=2767434 RepID=UPI00190A5D24|nr:cation efflux protein, CzcI-like [Acinetobacter sp. S40]MBJ9984056.1 cation transporter [Acinetobacter sp. S40]